VFGGSFPPQVSAHRIGELLAREGWGWQRRAPDILVSASGLAFGRAPDGAFILASDESRLHAALPARGAPPDIPRTGAGAFVVRRPRDVPKELRHALSSLGDLERAEASFEWGDPLSAVITLDYRGSAPPDALDRARALAARHWAPRKPPAIEPLGSAPGASRELRLRLAIEQEALDALAGEVGRRFAPAALSATRER